MLQGWRFIGYVGTSKFQLEAQTWLTVLEVVIHVIKPIRNAPLEHESPVMPQSGTCQSGHNPVCIKCRRGIILGKISKHEDIS